MSCSSKRPPAPVRRCSTAAIIVRAPLITTDSARVIGVRVAASGDDHDVHARVVIAADGRHSKIAFGMGLTKYAPTPKRWAFGAYFDRR